MTQKIIGAHVDLKGMVFRPEYIPQLLDDLSGQGINTVLLEYEDIFPFEGIDVAADRSVVWTKETQRAFVSMAAERGIEIIPLQQCLGHLEYVFRWSRYRHMSENPGHPSVLCPSNKEGKALVREMLRQVMEAHPDSRYVHIGLDEALGLGKCGACAGRSVPDLFLGYLEELCDFTESHGKVPIIWSDMLEDNFQPTRFSTLKDRVVLCVWDYYADGSRTPSARINGWRASREWREADSAPQRLPCGCIEDLPPEVLQELEPYRDGRWFKALFQVDLFTRLGFRIIGASASRISGDGPVLPHYHRRRANMGAWAEAVARNGQLGVIATSWARASSFYKPNFPMDLTWPCISALSRAMGGDPPEFWAGADQMLERMGRYRESGRFEPELESELAAADGGITAHRFEWESLALMFRVLRWQRRAEGVISDAEFACCGSRLTAEGWAARLRHLEELLTEAGGLRGEVRAHFEARYHGEALSEWIRALFDPHTARLEACRQKSAAGQESAKTIYG